MENQLELMVSSFNELYSRRPETKGEVLTPTEISEWWFNNQHRAVALKTSQLDGKTRTYHGEVIPTEKVKAQYVLNDLINYAGIVSRIIQPVEPVGEHEFW